MLKKDVDGRIVYSSIFILFCTVVVAATLHYSPWWGVVDDARNLVIAADFWKTPSVGSFYNIIKTEIISSGRFRPISQLWFISAYDLFRDFPVGVYLCMTLLGLATLPIWGKIINKIFPSTEDALFNLFVYPLSFFIFTPFWNNFMYISCLEKFVYFFGTFSIYFYMNAYETDSAIYIAMSTIFMVLGMLGKESGVALAGVYCVYSFLDYIVFRKNRRLSLIGFTMCTSIIVIYYFIIHRVCGSGYNVVYKNNFNPTAILTSFLAAPLVIKGLIASAASFACAGTAFVIRKRGSMIHQEYLLFPLFLGAYLIIISPLHFGNYYLAPLAPFLLLTLYPIYMLIGAGNATRRKALQGILIILTFLVLFFIIVPRISKMGDTKKIVVAIISLRNESAPVKFFLAPPFYETASMLQLYTDANISCLNNGVLSYNMLQPEAHNYIIFEDRCSSVTLRNVVVDREIYHNETWRVFSLNITMGSTSVFMPAFECNILQRIKDRIKSVR